MRLTARFLIGALVALSGCPGGGAGLGDPCSGNGDCGSQLQCVSDVCVPRCKRAPECGDGYACTSDGECVAATGQTGDACTAEVECATGLACQLDGTDVDAQGHLLATCGAATGPRPTGAACDADADCRNGTCALGRCVDLCGSQDPEGTRGCVDGEECTLVPRVGVAAGALFGACLPSLGVITWSIPVAGPEATLEVPVPANAESITLVMDVDDINQEVGALTVRDPTGVELYSVAADPFSTAVRHAPALAQSVLEIPSIPGSAQTPFRTGDYHVTVASLRPPFGGPPTIGSATPHVTAVAKLGSGSKLDLHFYFLDFTDHPCATAFGGETLTAAVARTSDFFQTDFLSELGTDLAFGSIKLSGTTYEDLTNHPDLDGLDVANASALLELGAHATGINVFFVRSLSPVGLQAFGPNPGPAGLAGTRQSGIVIGLDTLCYRSWTDVGRLTAHELARYMGLYDNVELGHPERTDPVPDSDSSSANLMFYSEIGGTQLSVGQRDILGRSAVLQ